MSSLILIELGLLIKNQNKPWLSSTIKTAKVVKFILTSKKFNANLYDL